MANFGPFEANVKTNTAGFTVAVSVGTTSSSFTLSASTSGFAPCILVTVFGSNPIYVRMADGADTNAATTTDIPILGNSVRLFANPSPDGTAHIAVIATATGNIAFFTPGQGGDE